jgi:5-methyltetrahydrofolate--homocysteine methyltransferase
MIKSLQELSGKFPLVSDGAWGTQLQNLGLPAGECPDSWNLSFPEQVEQVARSYVEAGSQIILTNTFRSNRIALSEYGLAEKTFELNRRGVEISCKAATGKAYVFASIGPTGKILLTGEVDEASLRTAFAEQSEALAGGGADALVIETMSDLKEALIALAAAKNTGLPVIVSMVFDSGKAKDYTMMGETPEQAVKALSAAGADAVGANCGQGIEGFIAICSRMKNSSKLPIWMKPNAGLPEHIDGKTVYRTNAGQFVEHVPELIKAGADFIGGCCGTDPDFIREIVKVLK